MKKFVKKLILLFISIQFAACEGNLEPHLYGVVDTGNAFSTPADLSAATVALYYELRQKGWGPYLFCDGSSFVMDEVSTEEWTTKWSWVAFLNGTWTDADQMVKGFYNWTAPNITRCTYTIAKMEESPVTQSVKDLYIAEVRALRAFFMFDLYRLYGPMPMILEADQAINPDPDYKPYRPTAEEVGTFITTELRAAADALPIEQAEYGRITKGAALHYLLKYYMHEKLWQNALETANEIIGLNYYELEKDYASIFSAQNEGNKELMFVVRAEPLADYGNHTYANILPGDYASPHGNIVEGWSGHRMPWEFYDTFDENDRRRALAQAEYTSKSGATIDLRASGDVGALPLKYGIDPEATGTWAGNDKVLDRYAEVLLFKAEALNELKGEPEYTEAADNTTYHVLYNPEEIMYYFNMIRYRAGLPGITLADAGDQVKMRQLIIRERMIEFACEGRRYHDLRRWGLAETEENKPVQGMDVTKKTTERDQFYTVVNVVHKYALRSFDRKMYFYPIPRAVLDKNAKLKQNPGWDGFGDW